MARLVLPQKDELRAFGGRPCFAPLLDIVNDYSEAIRLEVRLGDGEAWQTLVPCIAPSTSWASTRLTPIWLPRIASLRLVGTSGAEIWQRAAWGEGGIVRVRINPEA
jgi:hypothetical protein